MDLIIRPLNKLLAEYNALAEIHLAAWGEVWLDVRWRPARRAATRLACMTGVIRSRRRQGIATALKRRTIDYAKAQGVTWIQTSNEENNPMFQLNLLLGFQPAPAWLNFEKRPADPR